MNGILARRTRLEADCRWMISVFDRFHPRAIASISNVFLFSFLARIVEMLLFHFSWDSALFLHLFHFRATSWRFRIFFYTVFICTLMIAEKVVFCFVFCLMGGYIVYIHIASKKKKMCNKRCRKDVQKKHTQLQPHHGQCYQARLGITRICLARLAVWILSSSIRCEPLHSLEAGGSTLLIR